MVTLVSRVLSMRHVLSEVRQPEASLVAGTLPPATTLNIFAQAAWTAQMQTTSSRALMVGTHPRNSSNVLSVRHLMPALTRRLTSPSRSTVQLFVATIRMRTLQHPVSRAMQAITALG